MNEQQGTTSNFWLNAVMLDSREERNDFLEYTNANGVMTRPIWTLMNKLTIFKNSFSGSLVNSEFLERRIVNIPSGVYGNK